MLQMHPLKISLYEKGGKSRSHEGILQMTVSYEKLAIKSLQQHFIFICVFQERREREQQELESAKEIAEEDFDGFP